MTVDRRQASAAGDAAVQGTVVDGDLRVSGTEWRITWGREAPNGSPVVVVTTSEPKRNGTASPVVQQMGLETLELNEEARQRWASIVSRCQPSGW